MTAAAARSTALCAGAMGSSNLPRSSASTTCAIASGHTGDKCTSWQNAAKDRLSGAWADLGCFLHQHLLGKVAVRVQQQLRQGSGRGAVRRNR